MVVIFISGFIVILLSGLLINNSVIEWLYKRDDRYKRINKREWEQIQAENFQLKNKILENQ